MESGGGGELTELIRGVKRMNGCVLCRSIYVLFIHTHYGKLAYTYE